MVVQVKQGHVLDVLAGMPAKSVHVAVTSPPYWGLRAYGTPPQVWANPDGTPPCEGEHDLAWDGRTVSEHRTPEERARTSTLGIAADGSGQRMKPDNKAFVSAPTTAGHEWGPELVDHKRGADAGPSAQVANTKKRVCPPTTQQGAFCQHCGAWRGELGSEPTLDLFVSHLVAVFAAVGRVLRDDGTLWVNLGDSYASDSTYSAPRTMHAEAGWKEAGRRPNVNAHKTGLKAGDLCMAPARFALAMQAAGWRLRSEITLCKCLSGGTRVYARTAKGDMPVMLKDLVRLDPLTVKLWNGTRWTQVLAWTRHQPTVTPEERKAASGRRRSARQNGQEAAPSDYLELEFRSGERVGCTPEHRWPTQRGVVEASELRVGDVVPTVDLPEPDAARRPRALDDEDIGWFVGFYMAEGSKDDKTIRFSMHAKETAYFERLARVARDFHGSATWHVGGLNGNSGAAAVYGRVLHAILDTYITGHGAEGKHLTNACWQRSDPFLRALLQGYLDGDGSWVEQQRFWQIGFTRNYEFEADLRTLTARLGMDLRLRCRVAKLNGKEYPIHRGTLRPVASTYYNARQRGEIIAVRASRARVFWDVTVEDEPHLFSLASGLLTHNSAPMPESVQGARFERCRVKTAPQPSGGTRKVGQLGQRDVGSLESEEGRAEWADCPGCPKCAATDGLVQRWGSGRPTSAKESLFVFAKGTGAYYYDLEGVRVRMQDSSVSRLAQNVEAQEGSWRANGGAKTNGSMRAVGDPSSGRNLWNYVMWAPEPLTGHAHYAAYPRWLPRLAIQAGTSERGVCPTCQAPWLRVVERGAFKGNGNPIPYVDRPEMGSKMALSGEQLAAWKAENPTTTLGWRQSCRCPAHEPAPATVLDPFSGSGTTLIEANALGRHGIGVELQEKYVAISHKRLSGQPLSLFAHEGAAEFAGVAEVDALDTTKQEQHPNRTVAGFNQRWKVKHGAVGVAPEAAG